MNEKQKSTQDPDPPGRTGGLGPFRSSRARPLAALLACGLAVIVAFHVLLVAGAPWGAAAYGGSQTGQLPTELRVASAFQAAFWLLAALTALSRGGLTTGPLWSAFSKRAVWVLTAVLVVGAVINAASSSNWERFGWAPFVLALAILSLRLARSPINVPVGIEDAPLPRSNGSI